MKFIILLVWSLTAVVAQANEIVVSCNLKALPEMEKEGVSVDGTFVVEKISASDFILRVDAIATAPKEEPSEIKLEDKASVKVWNTATNPTAEEYVTADDDLNGIREYLLPQQSLNEFAAYVGEGSRDDGSGLTLLRYKTTEEKIGIMVAVGWAFLLCE